MKVYTPSHSVIHETSIDISNRVNISKPINLVQYDSLPIIKVDLYYGHERYTIPTGIDVIRLRMGRLPNQYYYKDILGWSPDKQSVYIQVEEDMTKYIGEFGLVIEFIEVDYSTEINKLMVAASSKINVTVERNPVQEDHINNQETEVK